MRDKQRNLFLYFIFLLLTLLIMLFFIELQLEKDHEEEESKHRSDELARIFPYVQQTLTDRLELAVASLLNQPGVIEAFDAGERRRLLALSRPFLDKKPGEVIHLLSFIKADNRHLLRVHAPEHFGDDISTLRPIIRQVNMEKKRYSGFEATLYGEYLLVFVPVFSETRYIGFVQAGITLEKVRSRLEEILHVPAAILVRTVALEKELKQKKRVDLGAYSVSAGPEFFAAAGREVLQAENGTNFLFGNHRYSVQQQAIRSDIGEAWGKVLLFYDVAPYEQARLKRIVSHLLIVFGAMFVLAVVLKRYYAFVNMALVRSEKLFKGIGESMGEGLYVLDNIGRLLFINEAGLKMLGFGFAELEGQNVHDLIHHHNPGGDPVPSHLCPILEVIRTGETYRANNDIFFKKDGGHLPVRHTTTPLFEKGNLTGSVTVFQDISVFKQNEAKLRELNRMLEGEIAEKSEALRVLNHAQEVAHIGHWELDLVYGRLEWSDEVYRIFGLEPGDSVPTLESFLGQVHPDDREWVSREYKKSVEEKSKYQIVHRVVRPDGEVRYVEERCSHAFDPEGAVVRSLGTVHDITERYLAEEMLRELNTTLEARVEEQTEELQTSNRILEKHVLDLEVMNAELTEAKEKALQAAQARSNFISSISHELRTPLNAIINFTDQVIEDFEEIAQNPELQKESRGYLQRVLVNSRHLLHLINELLEFTKAEAGKINYRIQVQDINPVVQIAYHNTYSLLSGSSVAFRLALSETPLMAAVDTKRLLQVLLNLLSNAAKFTREGFVEVRSFAEGQEVIIEVEDTGRGIPAPMQEVIFDPFSQVKGNDPGTGLGLGLVKRMCDDMHITVSITSVEGKGTIFRLTAKRITKVDA